jgi:hypothetical protein
LCVSWGTPRPYACETLENWEKEQRAPRVCVCVCVLACVHVCDMGRDRHDGAMVEPCPPHLLFRITRWYRVGSCFTTTFTSPRDSRTRPLHPHKGRLFQKGTTASEGRHNVTLDALEGIGIGCLPAPAGPHGIHRVALPAKRHMPRTTGDGGQVVSGRYTTPLRLHLRAHSVHTAYLAMTAPGWYVW